jgi:hypothetical protein
MLPLTLLLLLTGDFKQFLTELKRDPPCAASSIPVVRSRDQVWSERAGPWLVKERSIQIAPGVAVISGEVLQVGSTVGFRTRPVRILAILDRGDWRVHTAECGPEAPPFVITRLSSPD